MSASVCMILLTISIAQSQLITTTNRPAANLWDILRDKESSCQEKYTYGCKCDSLCARYGDCCRDSQYFKKEEQRLGASRFTCTNIYNSGRLYLISSCPPGWRDRETRNRCRNPDTTYRDPMFDVPVTSRRTSITYLNAYCASCNNDLDPSTDDIWPIQFECGSWKLHLLSLNTTTLLERLKYDNVVQSWVLNLSGISMANMYNTKRFPVSPVILSSGDYDEPTSQNDGDDDDEDRQEHLFSCSAIPTSPDALLDELRYCREDVISECAENWTDVRVREECEGYTSLQCFGTNTYRNYHCIKCNNVNSSAPHNCYRMSQVTYYFASNTPSFSVLLDWRGAKDQYFCNETQVYDPLSRGCRSTHRFENANVTDSCTTISFGPHEYIFDEDNMTAFVKAHNKTYHEDEFTIRNDSFLYVCVQEQEKQDDSILQYVTTVGLTLSIIFLILHLVVFIATPKLWNLSTMNLASLCVSLLFLYSTFVVSWFLKPQSKPCVVVAILIHYSLLASFCWMLVISFDIWRALRQATTRLRILSGLHRQRFCLYSAFSWVVPALTVAVALTMDHFVHESHVSPGYGVQKCWICNADALLVFVVAPLAAVMCLNIVFFSWSACLVFSTTSETVNTSNIHTDFRLYTRLAFVMGLTWIIGLVAGYVDLKGVWYLFVLFNTLQGLFIFIAFTCTNKVRKEVKALRKKRSHRHKTHTSEQSTVATVTTTIDISNFKEQKM